MSPYDVSLVGFANRIQKNVLLSTPRSAHKAANMTHIWREMMLLVEFYLTSISSTTFFTYQYPEISTIS